jgi:hypothetical protein
MKPMCLAFLMLCTTALAAQDADLVKQGVALDLNGQYADARKLFAKAIDAAATPQAKAQATRLRRVLRGRLQERAGGSAEGQSERPLHSRAHRPDLREGGR